MLELAGNTHDGLPNQKVKILKTKKFSPLFASNAISQFGKLRGLDHPSGSALSKNKRNPGFKQSKNTANSVISDLTFGGDQIFSQTTTAYAGNRMSEFLEIQTFSFSYIVFPSKRGNELPPDRSILRPPAALALIQIVSRFDGISSTYPD
ncbi:MAG: hypothetical protein ACTHM2_06040 [Afipia sp.]